MNTTKVTTTVTHPDGTKSTRTSKTRTYTHAVVVGPQHAAQAAANLRARANRQDAYADRLATAIAEGKVKMRSRGFAGNTYHTHEAWLVGGETIEGRRHIGHCAGDGTAEAYAFDGDDKLMRDSDGEHIRYETRARELVLDHARRSERHARQEAVRLREAAAEAELGRGLGTGYSVVRWTSRADLGLKAVAGEFSYAVDQGYEVTVVAVD